MPSKVWDEITYPFPNFTSCTVEVWEWMSNFMPHFKVDVITYPCWDLTNIHSISSSPHPPLMTHFPCCQFLHPSLAACSVAASISDQEAAHNWWCACYPCALERLFVWRGCRGRLNLCRLLSMTSWGLERQRENNLTQRSFWINFRKHINSFAFPIIPRHWNVTSCRDSFPWKTRICMFQS